MSVAINKILNINNYIMKLSSCGLGNRVFPLKKKYRSSNKVYKTK